LAIVVPRRSWLEISLRKLGKAGRKRSKERRKKEERREMVFKQPSSTAEIR
jgi:hypothetical protein